MDKRKLITNIEQALLPYKQIAFAYIHGSFVSSDSFRDIDIALYLVPEKYVDLAEQGETTLAFTIPTERNLEKELRLPVDIQILNEAPLSFRYRVISSGRLIIDNMQNLRVDFEYLSRVEYFDFRPRREEYFKEILTA